MTQHSKPSVAAARGPVTARDEGWCCTIAGSPLGSNCYLLPSSRGAVLIDAGHPRDERETLAAVLAQCGTDGVHTTVLTHSHADHTGAAGLLQQEAQSAIWAARSSCRARMALHEERLKLVPRPYRVDRVVDAETGIDMDDDRLRIIPTPGHADDHVTVFLERKRVLFCGDLFSYEDVGTLDITRSHRESLATMLESVKLCAGLDPVEIRPGHGPVLRRPARVFRTIEKRISLFEANPSILVAHTLMPLLLLLIEAHDGMLLQEVCDYALSHTSYFEEFLDGLGNDMMAHQLQKMLMILELKGLVVVADRRVYLARNALRAAV
ncbi:MAG: MBL fold metallo-hydrolase [Chitinivibrionales bacterium]|nr:MBL fold metallo-hydrolase [Chitinivibrionales bacterium]